MGNTYCIAITFCDDENNTFVDLGGAAWNKRKEWNDAWDGIPVSYGDASRCIADKIDESGDIVEDRRVSRETVEALLSKPIGQLIEEGRAA